MMAAVRALLHPNRDQFLWFIRLLHPAWLTLEGWIPWIWISIYACFSASALLSWRAAQSWGLNAVYLLVLVQSYA